MNHERNTSWHIVGALLARALPLVLAMLLGAALDAGLLDRRIAERVCAVLQVGEPRPFALNSSSSPRTPSRLLQ